MTDAWNTMPLRQLACVREIALAALLALSGCGGGGDPSDGAHNASPTTPALPKVAAQLKATYQAVTGRTTLQWTDVLPNEQNYELQRSSGTQWLTVQQVNAQSGQGLLMQTEADLAPGTVVRVIATTPVGTQVLATANLSETLTLAANAATLTLNTGSSAPLAGTVPVSIGGLTTAVAVQYLIDLAQQTRITSGTGYAWSWATTGVTDGTHLLQAVIETSPNSFVELRRQVAVDNPNVNLSLVAQAAGTDTAFTINTSSTGRSIALVTLSVDGVAQGVLSAPNACSFRSCDSLNAYRFTLANATLGNGNHTARVVAIDSAGETREVLQTFLVNSPPVISLTQPASGTVLSSNILLVQGNVQDDSSGVTVLVKVGDVTLPHNGSASFNLSYPLDGLPDGAYTVLIRATDAQGKVTELRRTFLRQSSSTFSYTPVLSLGTTGNLLASRGADLLVQQGSTVQWQRPQGTVTLQQANVNYASQWQLSSAGVSTYGVGNGWPFEGGPGYESYFWGDDGLRRSLSAEVSSSGGFDEHVTASGDWQVWSTRTPGVSYFLVNTGTHQNFRIALPADAQYGGNWQFTLVPGNGGVQVYFWATLTGSSGANQAYGVYRYDSRTGLSTRISPDGVRDIYVQTDGQRVAWQRSSANTADLNPPYTLVMTGVGSEALPITLSSTMQRFQMGDGLLAWQEADSAGLRSGIKVHDGQQTRVLSQTLGDALLGVGGGAVLYTSSGRSWLWTPAGGVRALLPVQVTAQISPGGLYLIVGEDNTVVHVTGW